jgi:hypothetical protein
MNRTTVPDSSGHVPRTTGDGQHTLKSVVCPVVPEASKQLLQIGARDRRNRRLATAQTERVIAPRQRELADLLAALLVADYKAFPPSTDSSPGGGDRG